MAVTVTACTPTQATATKSNAFAGGTITLSGLNGGVNFPSGSKVVILLGGDAAGPNGLPAAFQLANGTALNLVVQDAAGDDRPALFYADLALASGDSVSFTNGSNFNFVGAAAWYLTGAATGNASGANIGSQGYGTSSDPQNASATIPTGGAAVVGLGSFNGTNSTTQTISWSGGGVNAGGDFIERINPGLVIGGTSTTTAGTPIVDASGVGGIGNFNFIAGMVMAAWGPAPAGAAYILGGPMNLIQMKRKSIGWSPLMDHRRRVLRP